MGDSSRPRGPWKKLYAMTWSYYCGSFLAHNRRLIGLVVVAILIVGGAAAYLTFLQPKQIPPAMPEAPAKLKLETTKVKLGYSGFLSQIPDFVAAEKGFWRDEGLSVELKRVDPAVGLTAVISGDIDVLDHGFGPDFINAKMKGEDIVLLAGGWTITGGEGRDMGVFIRKDVYDEGIKTIKDLKGKKIGAPRKGGLVYMVFFEFMKRNGMKEGDFVFQFGAPAVLTRAFEAKALEAVMVGEPFTTLLLEKGHPAIAFEKDVFQKGETLQLTYLSAKRSWVDKNPNSVKAFLNGWRKALAYYLEVLDPKSPNQERRREIAGWTEKYLGVSTDTILKTHWDKYYQDGHIDVEALMKSQAYFIQVAATSDIILPEKFFVQGITVWK